MIFLLYIVDIAIKMTTRARMRWKLIKNVFGTRWFQRQRSRNTEHKSKL